MRLTLILLILSSTTTIDAFSVSFSSCSNANNWPILGQVYSCLAQSAITVTTAPNQTITSVSLPHSGGHSVNSQVSYVYFYGRIVNYIPHGLKTQFVNMIGLEISSCHLKAIEKTDIQTLPNLRVLKLNDNDLETLKSDLFEANTALQYVNFQYNKLKTVGPDVLKSLTKLSQALFVGSTCIDIDVTSSSSIAGLKIIFENSCATEDAIKKRVCQKDFDAYETEIKSLKNKNAEEKAENEKLKAELSQARLQLKATDENLNAATKNFHLLKNHVKNVDALNDELVANVTFNEAEPDRKTFPAPEDAKLICKDSMEKNSCEVYELKVKYPETKIQVTDQSHSELPSSEMKTLTATDMQTLFLPVDLAKHFPKLTNMSVVRSGLFEIDRHVFKGMLGLKALNLTQNKLHELKTDTFEDQTELIELDLSFNKIEVVNQGAFNGPANLEILLLNDNLLLKIDSRSIEHLRELKVLALNNNILNYVSPNLLSTFKKLTRADLTKNKCIDMSFDNSSLKDIETKLTDSCVAPIDFNCNFRVIKDLVDGSSSYMCSPQRLKIVNPKTRINSLKGKNVESYGFSDVKTLMISGQMTEFIPFEMAKTFLKLERIIVENSKLEKLQANDFEGMKTLKIIVITGNTIKSVHSDTFTEAPQLEYLDLSGNEIKNLPSGVFAALTKMKTLKLSNNELEKLSADILGRKNAIENFLFDSNQLEMIELKVLKVLRSATVIDLSNNGCIDAKFDENDKQTTKKDLFGEVTMLCTLDDD